MPLATRNGRPESTVMDIVNPQTTASAESVLDHQPYIEDTFINKTAFNPLTYAEDFQLLQRYTAGSRITVTYFLTSTPTAGLQRSDAIDPSMLRNPIQTSYTQINDFELVIQDKGFQTSFDADRTESKLTGVALIYPGMQPRMGDLFVTPVGDSKFGVFQVSNVERLTYRQGANHKITFFLREWGSGSTIRAIKASVTKEVWFDKETYLGDATTLLLEDSYLYLRTLRQMRGILIRYYYNTFYDKQMSSIMSPEGIYDPYLVSYLSSKISILDSIQRPTQLYPGIQNYGNSLWSCLGDVTNRRMVNIQPNSNLVKVRVTRWDVAITSLTNRVMVVLDNPNKQAMALIPPYANEGRVGLAPPSGFMPGDIIPPQSPLLYLQTIDGYVLTSNFYAGNKAAMTPFEFLVYAAIYDRKVVDIRDFIEGYLNRYADLTLDEQYYFIPLYLWLIDLAVSHIAAPTPFMT